MAKRFWGHRAATVQPPPQDLMAPENLGAAALTSPEFSLKCIFILEQS